MSGQSIRLLRCVGSLAGRAGYVGVDVHKISYWVALFSAEDGRIETYGCPACVESLNVASPHPPRMSRPFAQNLDRFTKRGSFVNE